jgi:hypothetical protein
MTVEKSKGEKYLEDENVLKLIIDYSKFKSTQMIVFRIKDIKELDHVPNMVQLGYVFIVTCQEFSKIFNFKTPSFQFTYESEHGIYIEVIFEEIDIDEELCKKYITETFSPEVKNFIDGFVEKKDINENTKVN